MSRHLLLSLALLSACGSRTYLDTGSAPDAAALAPDGGGPRSSKCVPGAAPVVFVSNAIDLVSDGNGLLFVERRVGDMSGVWSVSTADGSLGAPLFMDADLHITFAVDTTHFYWSYDSDNGFGVRRVPRSGGAVETLTTLPDFARGLAVDDRDVYVGLFSSTGGVRGLMRFPKSGGPIVAIADATYGFEVLALSATRVYARDPQWLWSFDKATDARTHNLLPWASRAVVDGEALFVTHGTDQWNGQPPTGRVYVLPGGVAPAILLAERQASPTSLAVDGAFVYWLNIGTLTHDDAGTRPDDNGTLMRMPKSGGTPVTVTPTPGANGTIVVDDECVYWAANGAIMKVHK